MAAAYEAVLATHAQQMEIWREAQVAIESRAKVAVAAAAESQIAIEAFTTALRRVTYRPGEPVSMDFLAAMDDAAAASPAHAGLQESVAACAVPGGREAVEALGSFLCEVEADRQARGTLEAQLRAESTRTEDLTNVSETLQVSAKHQEKARCHLMKPRPCRRVSGSSKRSSSHLRK